ncbi:MAG: molybdenum cofactor biosysynthesis protein [Kiritimatiellae bacterium]|jgi:MOSC domain-containing protein YiiM|nr:molybdenum cofactor biosysynthesis protein [Kiritimatiellia bacterium]
MSIRIEHIFISPEHSYVGHHGGPSGDAPMIELSEARLIAGRGIEGDRYAAREPGHPKQITFFDMAVVDELREIFSAQIRPHQVRRNIFVRGMALNDLVGKEFKIQGIRFEGSALCHPCYWMDEAIGSGAEEFLKMKGGLRARILEDGVLTTDQD